MDSTWSTWLSSCLGGHGYGREERGPDWEVLWEKLRIGYTGTKKSEGQQTLELDRVF